jgi:hypothetical protein
MNAIGANVNSNFKFLYCERWPRRRRRASLKARRPAILLRRMTGRISDASPVHKGEREIIARE